MKKILFATTALVATAGVASAEIALSGSAEMGIVGGDAYATSQFHTDVDVTFTMTGEADNGLTFGAVVDLDENGAFGNTTQGGETIHVAYGAARLTMGDTDGAFDWAMSEVGFGGAIADDHTSHAGFNGNSGMDNTYDGQIAALTYAFGDFSAALSVELDDGGNFDPVWGLGFKYSADLGGTTLNIGIGYQSGDQTNANVQMAAGLAAAGALVQGVGESNDAFFERSYAALTGVGLDKSDVIGVSLGATLSNGLQVGLNYSQANYDDFLGTETETHWGIGIGYTMNALTIGLNYGEYNDRFGFNGLEASGYGLAVDYDLGGGLVAQFGYGNSTTSAPGVSFSSDSYSLGLAMSF